MLSVKVDGMWLSVIGAYGPVTVEYGLHGAELASWEMDAKVRHPALRGNKPVAIYDGGLLIWTGNLVEPGSTGEYSARGSWYQAQGLPAMNVGGFLTTVPNDAIAGAVSRGEISWNYSASISAAVWATANGELTLASLLDGYAAETGMRWIVTPQQVVVMQADPTSPSWIVPHAVAGRGLTPAEDEFATHLVGTYLVSAGSFATATVGSAEAAAVFGRKTMAVDLTDMGFITSTRATAVLTGMFLRSGARMGWGEGLELAYGQITGMAGTLAPLEQIRSLQMVRLAGTVDTSRANVMPTYTDIVLQSVKYTDGSKQISMTPIGYAPRNLGDVLDASLETA